MVEIKLKISQEVMMKIEIEIENVFLELLFFEHGYLVYYSKSMHEILNSEECLRIFIQASVIFVLHKTQKISKRNLETFLRSIKD